MSTYASTLAREPALLKSEAKCIKVKAETLLVGSGVTNEGTGVSIALSLGNEGQQLDLEGTQAKIRRLDEKMRVFVT